MTEIESILKQGNIPKDLRKQLKQQFAISAGNSKKKELLRNEWFSTGVKLISSGVDANTILEGLNDLIRLLDSTDNPAPSQPEFKVGFSPGKDCKNLITDHLHGAKKTLDICVFTISDNDIANILIRLHKTGIAIRIISDNDKAQDEGSDLALMAEAGIPIKIDFTSNHMHHKFSIADGIEILTGSYNWTRSAEQHNQENLIVLNNPLIANTYSAEFNRLWANLIDF